MTTYEKITLLIGAIGLLVMVLTLGVSVVAVLLSLGVFK